MLKTSINAWSVEQSIGFEEMFRIISSVGFDGIELNLDYYTKEEARNSDCNHALTFDMTGGEIEEIKSFSEKYKLPVVSISTSMYNMMLGDNDEAVREKGKAILQRQLFLALKLGATGILVVPGGMKEGRSLLASWNNSLQTMKEIIPEIEEISGNKVKVDVENVWNGFFTSPFDMARFVDELGRDKFGAYLDLGNVHAFSWSQYWVEILANRIDKIHVKGFKRFGGVNGGGEFTNVTDGDINWQETMPLLAKTGFDGYITAEVGNDGLSWEDFYKITYSQVKAVCDMAL